jgi:hypothetical protein
MKPYSFEHFVFVCDNVLPEEQRAELIRLFEADSSVQAGRVVDHLGQRMQSADKVTDDLVMVPKGPWESIYQTVHEAVAGFVRIYAEQSPALQVAPLVWPAYKLQRYAKGEGYLRWHFDALGPGAFERVLGLILYLNDVKQGGETQFYHQQMQINPVVGRGILFPAGWTHMHCGTVPISSAKYIISTFISFALDAPETPND